MSRILPSAVAVVALGAGVLAQEGPPAVKSESTPAAKVMKPPPSDRLPVEDLIERRDHKLAAPWIELAPWRTDYDAARAESERTGKPIFAYFTRSYAA